MSSGSGHGQGHGSGGGRRRKNHEEHEEHENHERWLVSYADLVTVLMALFVVMFAISNVDRVKMAAFAASLSSSLGNPIVTIEGGNSPQPGTVDSEGPLNMGAAFAAPNRPQLTVSEEEKVKQAVDFDKAQEAMKEKERNRKAVEAEIDKLEATKAALRKALAERGLADAAKFRYDERGLVVSIVTDEVLFAAHRAELAAAGERVLTAIGPVLEAVPNDVAVEGHTNLAKEKPRYFPSEWELSSARAATVVRFLIQDEELPAERMSAVGLADQHPLIDGTDAVANRVNRRVEVIVVSSLPPAQAALLEKLAPDADPVTGPAAAAPADDGH